MSSSRRPSTLYIPYITSPPRSPHNAVPFLSYPSIPDASTSPTIDTDTGGPGGYANSRARSMSSRIPFLRPTRRELVLCFLTLSFSYLFFRTGGSDAGLSQSVVGGGIGSGGGAGHGADPDYEYGYAGGPGGMSGAGKLHEPGTAPSRWSFWPSSSHSGGGVGAAAAAGEGWREMTFWESVRTYGTTGNNGLAGDVPGRASGDKQTEDEFEYSGVLGKLGAEEWKGDKHRIMTTLVGHQPGWTLMERVYVYNGSLVVVTDKRNAWPELVRMTSTGKEANGEPGNSLTRLPTGKEIVFITPAEAARLWGPRVQMMSGTTWIFNDGQFVDHYYHFAAELLMGAWRSHAAFDPKIGPKGETNLTPPKRAWFLHQDVHQWRDKPRFNPTILFSLFPSLSLLYPSDWADLANATTANPLRPRAYMLERALLADRSAAFYGPWTGPTSRTVASALHLGEASRWWWEPVRRQILRQAGVAEDVLDRNLEGIGAVDPMHFDLEAEPAHAQPIGERPTELEPGNGTGEKGRYRDVVTYISRQSSRRHLAAESHEALVRALEKKSEEMDFELVIVEAEKMDIEEQFALAGRTTIMLGVHGNGLTHLIWMPATPRSAVIEMYIVGGFARDYQWTAHALGMRHFGINHDRIYTVPDLPPVVYPDGFHGTEITVDAQTVTDLIERRLKGLV